MNARRHYWLLTGLLGLISPPAWAQTSFSQADQTTLPPFVFFSAVLGVLLFMSLFTGAHYLLNRDPSYGWYALYLLVTTIWLWVAISAIFDRTPWLSKLTGIVLYMILLSYGMIMSYVRFISYVFDLHQRLARWERWVRQFYIYLTGAIVVYLLQPSAWEFLYAFIVLGSLSGFFILINYVMLFMLTVETQRSKHPLKRYGLAASILLLSGACASFMLNFISSENTDQLFRMPLFYLAIAILLEMLCFSLALGRRSYLNNVEKIRVQNDLIQQLEENQRLQLSNTVELERRLAQRETEVLAKARQLEEEHLNGLRTDFERRTTEAEMAGLRSQMNPHFIFNCLNSITLYATENDSEKAADYLTKFSRLIRRVLENSRSERVTLQNELEMLRLYADLEIMRFKQKLSVVIEVETGLDAGFVEIPPLLLQPYVENAIWHGLMHKPQGGTVSVRASLPTESILQLTITDDGVGRAKAAELKSKSASHRKSFGLKMTSERIALVNQLYQTHTEVTIKDLIDADGQPTGTEVILQIPL